MKDFNMYEIEQLSKYDNPVGSKRVKNVISMQAMYRQRCANGLG